jgi:predicted ATPase/DNA-binding winged helix-turn-helix (wHTH) protein
VLRQRRKRDAAHDAGIATRDASMEGPEVLAFGRFRVLTRRRELLENGTPVELGSRAFDVLMALIGGRGALVTKEELMDRVWPNLIVEENTLQSQIYALRKALGNDRNMVMTVPGRGYRFTGEIESLDSDQAAISPSPVQESSHFVSSEQGLVRKLTNLSAALSPLVGRGAEISELSSFISSHRLVTLTGAGGIGKTRLAIETARSLLPQFPDGVWVIELAPVPNPELISAAIAAAVGLPLASTASSISGIAIALSAKHLLLVFDNCEHLLDALAYPIEELLRTAAHLTILATSREPLRVEAEHVYEVPPLAVPPERVAAIEEIRNYGAVQLFCLRAEAASRRFSLDDRGFEAVAAICRRLDGIPLAIELAAGRAAALDVTAMATRLDELFDLLSGGRRTSFARHRTLRATLDWSYGLLAEDERVVLRRLSTFSGGFTLDAACAVTGDSESPSLVIDRVATLVAKSLITADRDGKQRRYRLLETTRAYALERLKQSGEIEVLRRRHAGYYRDLLQLAMEAEATEVAPLPIHAPEIDNVRAALAWAFADEGDLSLGVMLAASSSSLWLEMSLLSECRTWTETALANLDAAQARGTHSEMELQIGLSILLWPIGVTGDQSSAAATRALELAELLQDQNCQLRALYCLWLFHLVPGTVQLVRGTVQLALRFAYQFDTVAKGMARLSDMATAQRMIGIALHFIGDQAAARTHLEQALQSEIRMRRPTYAAPFYLDHHTGALSFLTHVLWAQGLPDQAVQTGRLAISEARATDHSVSICHALFFGGAFVSLKVGDLASTERYAAELIAQAEELSADLYRTHGLAIRAVLLAKRGDPISGLDLLRPQADVFRNAKYHFFHMAFGADLAEILGQAGQVEQGLATVHEAIESINSSGAFSTMPELLRVKGELEFTHLGLEVATAVERTLKQSLDCARQQGALSWELRTAISLARLKERQGQRDEAFAVLASVYERFQEGFETADLQHAKMLLDDLT